MAVPTRNALRIKYTLAFEDSMKSNVSLIIFIIICGNDNILGVLDEVKYYSRDFDLYLYVCDSLKMKNRIYSSH